MWSELGQKKRGLGLREELPGTLGRKALPTDKIGRKLKKLSRSHLSCQGGANC